MQKVAIPTDGANRLMHFGHAHTMSIFTIDGGRVVNRENRLNPDPEHLDPAHHKIMMNLAQGADVVVASHMGPPMVTSLNRVGMRVLAAPSEDVEASLQAFLQSTQGGPALPELTVEAAGGNGGHDHNHEHHHH